MAVRIERAKSLTSTRPSESARTVAIATSTPESVLATGLAIVGLNQLSAGVFSKDVKYDSEHTGFGWKTLSTATAADLTLPTTCKMKRPAS